MNDEALMRRALELAEQGRYSVSPNPMVGCVIARDGAILAEGWHQRAGEAHAEVEALRHAASARGATAYVTLEPCSHYGRTPPCADALIASGVKRVVVATLDPHERVNGTGIQRLKEAGIEVTNGVCEPEARRQNEKFLWSSTQKLPFVLLKAGMTLDGKLATASRESQWITSDAARESSLRLREEYDAIMVGSGTVRSDNPRLTRRLALSQSILPLTRVILDGDGEVSPHAQVFSAEGRTILYTAKPSADLPTTVEVILTEGRVDLARVLSDLYARGVQSLMVEGGSAVHAEFIRRSLWQKMICFVAPMLIGEGGPSLFSDPSVTRLTEAVRFRFDRAQFVGGDLMITAYPS